MDEEVHDPVARGPGGGRDRVRDRRQEGGIAEAYRPFAGRTVTLGVASGIACYKAVDLMRDLQRAGARVRVVLTSAASELVRPALFEALSGERVGTGLWGDWGTAEPGGTGSEYARFPHLDFARGIDAVVVAPATANTLGKAVAGIADDLLTTTLAAVEPSRTPVLFVPTMNATMYDHPACRANRSTLRERGAFILTPDEGPLACGETGVGRWPGNAAILAALDRLVNGRGRLSGRRVVVTAGPTEAAIDPARVLTNRSSGKMGYALAGAAWREGAEVTLIHGPTRLEAPPFVRTVSVRTTAELSEVVAEALPGAAQLWMAAAPADFGPDRENPTKLKKDEWDGRLALERSEDVLARAVVERDASTVIVGFAVETDDVEAKAAEKLVSKGCDFLVVNDPTEAGAGFGHDTNRVFAIGADGSRRDFELMSKRSLAHELVDWVLDRREREAEVAS
ncbi:MAG: bifunctional phosphopantothenoylcysteine decarboxylase/phosphopantothenate--cysteine ligase CoaBC [Gemmatimonadetes bacterium]|nr:bifunctional phosphopantothenoylcysteine decarboxylase/phosphopantothenate--cysteine ligase CoaBC [Gemmatimonadota bacterium]